MTFRWRLDRQRSNSFHRSRNSTVTLVQRIPLSTVEQRSNGSPREEQNCYIPERRGTELGGGTKMGGHDHPPPEQNCSYPLASYGQGAFPF